MLSHTLTYRFCRRRVVAVTHTDIQVLQKKKLFPFGTAVNAQKYNHNVAGGKYQAFIHNHFNWAVPGNALKWRQFDWHQVGIGWLNSLEEQRWLLLPGGATLAATPC